LIQSARENIVELRELHHVESATKRLKFIDSLLADSQDIFSAAEWVEGVVRVPKQM